MFLYYSCFTCRLKAKTLQTNPSALNVHTHTHRRLYRGIYTHDGHKFPGRTEMALSECCMFFESVDSFDL